MKKLVVLCSLLGVVLVSTLVVNLLDHKEQSSDVQTLKENQLEVKKEGPSLVTTTPKASLNSGKDANPVGIVQDDVDETSHEEFTARYDMQVDMYDEESAPEVDMNADYDSYKVDMPQGDGAVVEMSPGADELSRE